MMKTKTINKSPCRLCLENKELCDSHILPEFVFRPTYNKQHRAVKADLEKKKISRLQKGFSERLLCKYCEERFSRLETYFANIWFNKKFRLRPIIIANELIEIEGLDYKKIKLFLLSLLWRAGVSSLNEFKSVDLGPHAENIRIMLLNGDPGDPEDYQLACFALRDPRTMGFMDNILRAFEASKVDGHRVFSVIFGGVDWAYWVSRHSHNRIAPPCLKKDGTLILAVDDYGRHKSVQDFSKRLRGIKSRQNNDLE